MIALCVPSIVSWVMILITKPLQVTNPALFYVGRILQGFAGCSMTFILPIYVTETAELRVQGALCNVMQLMITAGIAFANGLAINSVADWLQTSAIFTAISAVVAFVVLFLPNSPVYYLRQGKTESARKSLEWLRGKNYSGLDNELEMIKERLSASESGADGGEGISLIEMITSPVYLKPTAIACFILFLQQWGGGNTASIYTQQILIKAGITIDTGLGSFLVMLAQMLATACAVLVVEKVGRKAMLIGSLSVCCLSVGCLGTYFYLEENAGPNGIVSHETIANLGWFPLTSLIIFFVGFSFGLGPIAWTLNVELHPRESQNMMSSVGTFACFLFAFLIGKFSTNIENSIHTSGLYFLNSALCLVGLLFCIIVLPETKGKTAEDMKQYFSGDKGCQLEEMHHL